MQGFAMFGVSAIPSKAKNADGRLSLNWSSSWLATIIVTFRSICKRVHHDYATY